MKEVTICPVLNGWIVKVGCQTIVFANKGYMLDELDKYIQNPSEVEKEYIEKAVNKEILQRGTTDIPTIERDVPRYIHS